MRKHLVQHEATHKKDKKEKTKVVCLICETEFSNKKNLQRHTANKHCKKLESSIGFGVFESVPKVVPKKNTMFQCEKCPYATKQSNDLKNMKKMFIKRLKQRKKLNVIFVNSLQIIGGF